MNAKADAKSGDDMPPAIRALQQQLKKQLLLAPLTLLPGIIALAVASMWLPSIHRNAAANPLIDITAHMEAVDSKARELASQQVKLKTHLSGLPLKPLREWQDPRINIVKYLIDTEQEQQTFMLHALRGLRDLGDLMKGIDEWSYFKYTQVRRLVERSRIRQQSLREQLDALTADQEATRKLTPKS